MKREKQQLRTKHKAIRAGQSVEGAKAASFEILQNLLQLPVWNQSLDIHSYLAIEKRLEVNTWPLVAWLQMNGYGVSVPVMEDGKLKSSYVGDAKLDDFKEDEFGVAIPPSACPTTGMKFDIIIVPCVAADLYRYRLGYGGGHYDKFLASQPHATKIGLCYDANIEEALPHEKHDINLTRIVTESRII